MRRIYLAGGCFWGVEAFLKRIEGVVDTQVGYANGHTKNPSYEEVCRQASGHVECVQVEYDDTLIQTKALIEAYFSVVDPTTKNAQKGDIGSQYRTGIYYVDEQDVACIKEVIEKEQEKYEKDIVVEVMPIKCFYDAEAYHQDYLDKNPNGYCHIR